MTSKTVKVLEQLNESLRLVNEEARRVMMVAEEDSYTRQLHDTQMAIIEAIERLADTAQSAKAPSAK